MIVPNPTGQLVIGGFALETNAWGIENSLVPLWFPGNFHTVDPIHIPGKNGDIHYPYDLATFEHNLELSVIGDVNSAGVAYADAVEGLEFNINAIRTALDPTNVGNGARSSQLIMPSGATRTASVMLGPATAPVVHINDGSNCPNAEHTTVYARIIYPMRVIEGVFS